MAKDKLTDYDSTASNNLDVGGISVAEGMLPSNVNNAIREQMSHLKDFAEGTQPINALAVDNLKMDGNTISSTDTNGDITIDPDGTGDTIVASGNVGIGTSPTNSLDAAGKIRVRDGGNTTIPSIQLGASGVDGLSLPTTNTLCFITNSTERMRIGGGEVLVGTTDTSVYNNVTGTGVVIEPNSIQVARSGGPTLLLNRQSSDGEIQRFLKDGTTVGSIGTDSGDLTIDGAASHTGLRFVSSYIQPRLNGSASNGGVDLGVSVSRFKDLYLSGGVYLGGTGSANYLDDYEEGTWTPIFSDGTGSDKYSGSYTIQSGYYRKVGSLCMCGFDFLGATLASTSGTYLTIGGLPFSGNAGGNPISIGNIAYMQNIGHSTIQGGYVNGTHMYLVVSGTTHASPSTLSNSARVIGGLTYITT